MPMAAKFLTNGDMTDLKLYRYAYPPMVILGFLLSIMVYANTQEKIIQAKTHVVQVKFIDTIRAVAKNKYFWIISLAGWIGFLEASYGTILQWLYQYQHACTEGQFALIQTINGLSLIHILSKKKHKVMEQERKNFIYGLVHEDGSVECEGAVKRGVNEKIANELFDEMSSFASYAFNKSHAAAYAYVAYQTAWLKCHYPCEFMAALLTSVLDSAGKVSGYIAECSRIHIAVLPPHVNESLEGFTVVDGRIRFGLLAVKNLGRGFIKGILEERKTGGPFTSFYSFCKRIYGGKDVNRLSLIHISYCTLGVSNEILPSGGEISVKSGTLLLVFSKD